MKYDAAARNGETKHAALKYRQVMYEAVKHRAVKYETAKHVEKQSMAAAKQGSDSEVWASEAKCSEI